MEIILHRVNTSLQLRDMPTEFGAEIDIRSSGNKLILSHDPFTEGIEFDEWLKYYKHGTLILNVKEEGLEDYILRSLSKYNIEDFFFLDQSFPFIIKTIKGNENRTAIRVSEYESVLTPLTLSAKAKWIWVDHFEQLTLSSVEADELRNAGFKLCLVSPELQQRECELELTKKLVNDRKLYFDAVCTKKPYFWK